MEIVFGIACVAFIILIGYHCMKESDETRRRKEFAAERIARMQREREVQAQFEYDRQRHTHKTPRSAPITTGTPKSYSGTTPVKTEVKRRDNSFENVVDSYEAPTYHSSHKSSGGCSGGGSSSSDSSSSSSDSGGGGCD